MNVKVGPVKMVGHVWMGPIATGVLVLLDMTEHIVKPVIFFNERSFQKKFFFRIFQYHRMSFFF